MYYKNIFFSLFFIIFLSYIHHTTAMKPILHQEEWSKMIFDVCQKGYFTEEIIDYINQGGSFNIKGENNITPLHVACKCNHLDIVNFLLVYNADINAPMNGFFTPLHSSVLARNVKIIQCLLNAGANIDAQTIHGDTALDLAYLIKDNEKTIKEVIIELFSITMRERLLTDNSDVDTTLVESFTPLHCSVFTQNVMRTQHLLNVGADVNAQTTYGYTALDLACLMENEVIIELFPNQSSEESSS
jgi:ankyrin repeat protein